MAFEKLKQITKPIEELHRERLDSRYQGLDLVRIGEAPMRVPVRIGGEVESLHVVPRADSSTLEVTVADGTGKAVAVFLGRRRIASLSPGRHLVLEGVLHKDEHRIVMINPAYTFS